MEVVRLHPEFGVEIRGISVIDVASSAKAYNAVRAAFEEHSVLLFRDQSIDDDIQAVFSRAFGPLELTKVGAQGSGTFYARLNNIGSDGEPVPPGHRETLIARANQLWHTDSSFKQTPALASVLSARLIPGEGGETQFTSTRSAWNRLSETLKHRLRTAVATHDYLTSRSKIDAAVVTPEERAALPPVDWRMVWSNPANGHEALYIASHAGAIHGMGDNEAMELLENLMQEATRSASTYLHRWRPGDVVMWDNRATMHRGRPWPQDQVRSMVRTTISAVEADGLSEVRPTDKAA